MPNFIEKQIAKKTARTITDDSVYKARAKWMVNGVSFVIAFLIIAQSRIVLNW